MKKSAQPPEEIRLTEACCIDGRYFEPGSLLPYASASEVPVNLQHLIAADESELPPPIVRNLYDDTPQPEPRYTYQSTGGLRGDARQAVQGWHAADEAAEFANQPLAPEIEEALKTSTPRPARWRRRKYRDTRSRSTAFTSRSRRRRSRFSVSRSVVPFILEFRRSLSNQVNPTYKTPWTFRQL